MMATLAIGAEAKPGGKGGGKGKPTTTTTVAAESGWVLEALDSGVFDRLVVEVAAADVVSGPIRPSMVPSSLESAHTSGRDMAPSLRPIERIIVRELDRGTPLSEIAVSLRKRPGTVRRIAAMVNLIHELDLERDHARTTDVDGIRPIERCIRRLRAEGQSVGEVASRVRRGGDYVRRVESYIQLKQAIRREVAG